MDYKIHRLNKDNQDFFIKNSFDKDRFLDAEAFLESDCGIAYFVSSKEEVLGYIYGYQLPRFNSRPMLYIHSVDVNQTYRQLGIGTLMMDTMLEYAKENKLLKVFLITNKSNHKAIGLYKKVDGKVPHEDDVVMEWKLK